MRRFLCPQRLADCGVGASYLAVADVDDDPSSILIAQHIRDALEGQALVPLRVRLACDSPTAPRSFDLLISSRLDDRARCLGATVSFSPVVSSAAAGTATDQPAAVDSRFTVSEHATASLGVDGAAELARIGGQLQQRVVHELYATSLGICSILDRVGDPLALDRLTGTVKHLDATVGYLRHLMVELGAPADRVDLRSTV